MKSLTASMVILAVLLLTASTLAQDSLRVISINIQGQRPGSDPETRMVFILQELKRLNPDIIGIQEINEDVNGSGADNQGQLIADSLSAHFGTPYTLYQAFTHLSWNNQFREFVGIITRLPVAQQGFLSLPAGTFPRRVVWNALDTPLGRINFFNTHLSFNSEFVRIRQVEALLPYVTQQESLFPGVAAIVTGDFNAIPGSPPIQPLTASGLDTFYYDSFREINPADPGYTVPANSPNARIDYVFSKYPGQLEIDTSMVIMATPYSGNNYPSDHRGVLTVFRADSSASDMVLPRRINMGGTLPGVSKDSTIFIRNPGSATLQITGINSSVPDFFVDRGVFSVAAGGAEPLRISFTPPASGPVQGYLTINNSAGRDRYLALSGNGQSILPARELNFGPVLINATVDTPFTLSNPSSSPIEVQAITSSDPAYSATPIQFNLPPGGSRTIQISFTPDRPGGIAAIMTFLTDTGNPELSLSGAGLERSSWAPQNSGTGQELFSVFFDNGQRGWTCGNAGIILTTGDGGTNWTPQNSGTGQSLRSIFFVDDQSGWAAGVGGTILNTTDGGATWTPQNSGSGEAFIDIFFLDAQSGWAAGNRGVLLHSSDGGSSWTPQPSGVLEALTGVIFIDPSRGWVSGSGGTILHSSDGGASWARQVSGSSEVLRSVDFSDAQNGLMTGNRGTILQSSDGGTSWTTQQSWTMEDLNSVFLGDGQRGWAAGKSGFIMRSSDGGANWIPQQSGTSIQLNSIFFAGPDSGFAVGKSGSIFYTTSGGVVAIGVEENQDDLTPGQFQLAQNYPNPFNPVTTIRFALPEAAEVNLAIFDILGRMIVGAYHNTPLSSGWHEYTWRGRDDAGRPVASGVYLYRVQAGDFLQTRKMLLIK